jgi:uncharacterized membrane protein YdjX (TVP38/TMEM64 family)
MTAPAGSATYAPTIFDMIKQNWLVILIIYIIMLIVLTVIIVPTTVITTANNKSQTEIVDQT